jgi:hypothetical protein
MVKSPLSLRLFGRKSPLFNDTEGKCPWEYRKKEKMPKVIKNLTPLYETKPVSLGSRSMKAPYYVGHV